MPLADVCVSDCNGKPTVTPMESGLRGLVLESATRRETPKII